MKNIFKNIIAIIIFGIAVFIFRDSLLRGFFILQDKYFPCTRIITYSLGTIDSDFGISKESFLNTIKDGENMWETSINKNLFEYVAEDGKLTINLIYDNRQENTQKLKVIDSSLQGQKNSYNDLKNKINVLEKEYRDKKFIFESKVNSLKNKQGRYSPEDALMLNNLQIELNNDVININSLVSQLNDGVKSFNNQAENYNNIGNEMGDEFEEGLYHSDNNGKYIDIYQFEDKNKLARVLMHELGHALSLEHNNNPDDIMYQLNIGTNLEPSTNDINGLKTHCGIK